MYCLLNLSVGGIISITICLRSPSSSACSSRYRVLSSSIIVNLEFFEKLAYPIRWF